MCKEHSSFIGGAILGGLIGAAVGMLLAPASGKETREKIKSRSQELITEGEEKLEEVKSEVESKAGEVMEKVQDEVTGKAEEVMERVQEAVNEMTATINKAKKRTFKGIQH